MAEARYALMQGNEAVVEGAIAAGMRFFAGYPITPSTEIAEGSALKLPMVGGKFMQMEDELASIAAAIGASIAGVKSMTATSGPGFSLKQENLGYACEAEIPVVVVDVQRAGPSTGLPTSPSQGDYMQAKYGTHGDHPVIALSPASVQEAYLEAVRAFNLAEKYMTPVIFLMDEIVGHMREGIDLKLPDDLKIVDRLKPVSPERGREPYKMEAGELAPRLAPFGEGIYYNITGLIHGPDGFPTNSNDVAARECRRLLDKIELNRADIEKNEEYKLDDAEVAVVTFGGTARSVLAAVDQAREAGIKAGMFRPITVWPFPSKSVCALSKRVKHIIVAELNDGQMTGEVERAVAGACPVTHIGKLNGTILKPAEILTAIREVAK